MDHLQGLPKAALGSCRGDFCLIHLFWKYLSGTYQLPDSLGGSRNCPSWLPRWLKSPGNRCHWAQGQAQARLEGCVFCSKGRSGWVAGRGWPASLVWPGRAAWRCTVEPSPQCADRAHLHVPGSGCSDCIFLQIVTLGRGFQWWL